MFRRLMERLGWIQAPRASLAQWRTLVAFADAARRDGLTHVLVCGMGGSSLTAEVVARANGATSLQVLDSTDPAAVLDAESAVSRDHTLFLVVSKSGTTVETLALYRYFAARARPEQLVVVTDPGTPLEALAREGRLRAVFPHPPDVGGRYAALTVVGMLPAALIGAAGRVLLERALAVDVARAKAWGVALARAALAGRDKLVLRPPARVAAIAAWVEQLVAESSGKAGRGVVPLVDDPAAERRPDTQIVSEFSADPLDLGAEFLKWELATWELCNELDVNAFDQPDVEAAKAFAREELARRRPGAGDVGAVLTAAQLARAARPGDYLAILAYLPPRRVLERVGNRAPLPGCEDGARALKRPPSVPLSLGQLGSESSQQGARIDPIARSLRLGLQRICDRAVARIERVGDSLQPGHLLGGEPQRIAQAEDDHDRIGEAFREPGGDILRHRAVRAQTRARAGAGARAEPDGADRDAPLERDLEGHRDTAAGAGGGPEPAVHVVAEPVGCGVEGARVPEDGIGPGG